MSPLCAESACTKNRRALVSCTRILEVGKWLSAGAVAPLLSRAIKSNALSEISFISSGGCAVEKPGGIEAPVEYYLKINCNMFSGNFLLWS